MTQPARSNSDVLDEITSAWEELHEFLRRLGPDQITAIRDAEGWSIKDHIAHLAVWEDSVAVLFRGRPRHEALGVSPEEYARHSFDEINAILWRRRKDSSPDAILTELGDIHSRLLGSLKELSGENLARPVRDVFPQAPASDDRPAADLILDNTSRHYSEHLAWMKAILERSEEPEP
jgi:hypothetical protein